MSEELNDKTLLDTEFYACGVGAAKPKVEFFEKVVAQLGCDASAVLFLDDRTENVAAAKQAGLNAVVFFGADGAPALRHQWAGFGVFVHHCAQCTRHPPFHPMPNAVIEAHRP